MDGHLCIHLSDPDDDGDKIPFCGCIVADPTPEMEIDYICEPLRSEDFQKFLNRMDNELKYHLMAKEYVSTLPDKYEPPEEAGNPVCPAESKQILGYFKNKGVTLCWVVMPHRQIVKRANCDGDSCCGASTRCEPHGYTLSKYLVYCDALLTDYEGCLIGTDTLRDTMPQGCEDRRKKRSEESSFYNSTFSERETRQGCPVNEHYYAFRHDFLPSVCTCRKQNC
ncbi:uncharacterized protein [Argopecten irradians]|uniref:uncharacterized protein n=1 Tax=Argopecten irradians TaxID=31199 RepID=UPI003712D954